MSGTSTNMAHANYAIYTVRQVHSLLAGNRPLEQLQSVGRFELAGHCVKDSRSQVKSPRYTIAWIREKARIARERRCGNCEEMSCLAFETLMDMKTSPLDILGLKHADHGFVVIGRLTHSDLNAPSTWGQDAVICDPWEYKAYPAIYMQTRMTIAGGKTTCKLLMRWEPGNTHSLVPNA